MAELTEQLNALKVEKVRVHGSWRGLSPNLNLGCIAICAVRGYSDQAYHRVRGLMCCGFCYQPSPLMGDLLAL